MSLRSRFEAVKRTLAKEDILPYGFSMTKQHVALLFGGRSVEHAISVTSARCILEALDPARYRVSLVFVDPSGRWRISDAEDGFEAVFHGHEVILRGVPSHGLLVTDASSGKVSQLEIDVVFPILHGHHGEDGSLQGLLELAELPYVGSGVTASAIQMDKDVSKRLLAADGIPVVPYVLLRTGAAAPRELEDAGRGALAQVGLPAFVKPANSGSSVGTRRVEHEAEMRAAIENAARYDEKILVEEAIDAREIEVAVLGNEPPLTSPPGEIGISQSFYDYEAKYLSAETPLVIPAEIPASLATQLRDVAAKAYRTVGAEGMARVDFLLDRSSDRFYINELNSLPGFTEGSMFPRLFEAAGISYRELLDRLIDLALERHARRQRLETHYDT